MEAFKTRVALGIKTSLSWNIWFLPFGESKKRVRLEHNRLWSSMAGNMCGICPLLLSTDYKRYVVKNVCRYKSKQVFLEAFIHEKNPLQIKIYAIRSYCLQYGLVDDKDEGITFKYLLWWFRCSFWWSVFKIFSGPDLLRATEVLKEVLLRSYRST